MRLRNVLAAAAAGLLAVVLVPGAAHAAAPTDGGDVSRYQCAAPPDLGDFAVVAVNTGVPIETNPCLGTQLAWAAAAPGVGHPAVEVYLASANPDPKAASWWPKGSRTKAGKAVRSPYGACDGSASRACSWVYGNSIARDDVHRGVVGPIGRWWIDIEGSPDGNSWSASTARNRAAVEGMIAGLRAAKMPVGIYSATSHFREVLGTVPSSSPIAALPSWIAGASDRAAALARCSGASLTAGRLTLVQWIDGVDRTADHDVACGTLTRTPTPKVSGHLRVRATLTARAGTWAPGAVRLAYRWTRDGHAIAGATKPTYTVRPADRAHRIAVVVTGTESGYSRVVRTSAAHRIAR